MSVFEEHTERLEAEALGAMLDALVKEQKRCATRMSEEEFQRWARSPRHRLATWLERLAEWLDVDPPEPIDWRKVRLG